MNEMEETTPTKVGNLLSRYEIPKPKEKDRRTERGELLKYFVEEINKERIGTTYKPVSIGYIASRVTKIGDGDLYFLRNICDRAKGEGKSFSKVFFGSLKSRSQ